LISIFIANIIIVLGVIAGMVVYYENRELSTGIIPEEEPEPIYEAPVVVVGWFSGEKCPGRLLTNFNYKEYTKTKESCE
jgi:hypothetical protein